MTLVSQIITDAYRETNLIPLGATPNTNQMAAGLNSLNRIISSTLGFEVNDELRDLNIGGDVDQTIYTEEWVPDNIRLLLNLTAAASFDLDPAPFDGQRFSIVDVGGNLATFNVTINGNGRRIEDAASVVENTDDLVKTWMYRADTGNWIVIATSEEADQMPFPEEFDDYFILMLAMRINPNYGQTLAPESVNRLSSMRSKIRSRYRKQINFMQADPGLVRYDDFYGWFGNAAFNSGRPWPWQM